MTREQLRRLLAGVRTGRVSPAEAAEKIARLGTADLGFARLDRHREVRRGLPEVVFGEGKSTEQIVAICEELARSAGTVLATRLSPEAGAAIAERLPRGEYDALARTFALLPRRRRRRKGLVIVSAGTADLPVAREAAVCARAFGLEPDTLDDVGVAGLHRLLDELPRLRAARVVIVVAGMEGALASVVAGLVPAPVIGVPTSVGYGASEGGWTALRAMLSSCAGGLCVVNIDNGFGAAAAAAAILR